MSQIKHKAYYPSPIGLIEICGTEKGICGIHFCEKEDSDFAHLSQPHFILDALFQLDGYFYEKRKNLEIISDIDVTDIHLKVYQAVQNIPAGEFRTYSEIANICQISGKTRQVMQIINSNPLKIVIPCHRVRANQQKAQKTSVWGQKKLWLARFESVQQALFQQVIQHKI